MYSSCNLCNRCCAVDRSKGETGYCGQSSQLRVACTGLHRGEEPVLTGAGGSGTVFFSGCTLRCAYCQNYQISCEDMGAEISDEELVCLFLQLQDAGAENINLVTPTHFTPGVCEALHKAKNLGLSIPIVFNSSGYDNNEVLSLIAEVVDVYLPDVKVVDARIAETMQLPPDYEEIAVDAVTNMVERKTVRYNGTLLSEGVIVRHLVLPNMLENTRSVLAWFSQHVKERALLSLLTQFRPPKRCRDSRWYERSGVPERALTRSEYETVLRYLDEFGIEQGFYQESPDDSGWTPDFSSPPVFPSDEFTLLWHWREQNGVAR